MNGRVRSLSGHKITHLTAGWEMTLTPPLAVSTPEALNNLAFTWVPATAPSTAASVLREAGLWGLDGPPRRFDAEDVWYRTRFSVEASTTELFLCLDGLATVAEVWLNDELVLSSQNMFVAHEIPLHNFSGETNLALCFRAVDEHLKQRRPRPRWRAPMVENQQLRWVRTSLLGRTPGWSPPAAHVGPWRAVYLQQRSVFQVDKVKLQAHVVGENGVLQIEARICGSDNAELIIERSGQSWRTPLTFTNETATGILHIENVQKWWPHTHGKPVLYAARIRAGEHEVDLGFVGFRTIEVKTENGDFALSVNGVPVFCRGACWTPLDVVSLHAAPEAIEKAVLQARDAGMNMLRLSGTLTEESDAFYDACDRHGILIWQDFNFANLDYPDDENFNENVEIEARQLLSRLNGRPCLAMLCGNSEGEQQAAMWGATRDYWVPGLFHEILPQIARELCPDVPYWPSSAHGGAFPHQANQGTTSYYGVGAYLRPLTDARRAEVRFATECLAFANVPDEANLKAIPGGLTNRAHHPQWKARVPRDLGAGWDFDDVRDFYLKEVFKIDPIALRSVDHERYLQLSRVVTGEVMAATFAEWRRAESPTQGALIWFLRDLWPGAGWGIVDSQGRPKAAWYYLKRALAPLAVFLSDEGQSGLHLHFINEGAEPFTGEVELAFYRDGEIPVGHGRRAIPLAPRDNVHWNAGELLDHFVDASYAYRFGPPAHDLVVATLHDSEGEFRSQAFFFPIGLPCSQRRDLDLRAKAQSLGENEWILHVTSNGFAQSVFADVAGFETSDNYFHIAPGGERSILLRRTISGEGAPTGTLQALNAETQTPITIIS